MKVIMHFCDRCKREFHTIGQGSRHGVTLTVNYYQAPRTIELCVDCEAELTIWLGKHPRSGMPLDDLLDGRYEGGGGYPNRDQIERERDRRGLEPLEKRLSRGT